MRQQYLKTKETFKMELRRFISKTIPLQLIINRWVKTCLSLK